MSATNLTKNLKLSQFVASDKPSWLGDVNGDNKKIDDGYGVLAGEISKANDTASSAKSQSDANTQTLTNVNSELEDYGNRITALEAGGGTEQLEQRVNTLDNDVEALQTRADTFEADIAQNETNITNLTSKITTVENKAKTNEDNITSLQTTTDSLSANIRTLTSKSETNTSNIRANTNKINALTIKTNTLESKINEIGGSTTSSTSQIASTGNMPANGFILTRTKTGFFISGSAFAGTEALTISSPMLSFDTTGIDEGLLTTTTSVPVMLDSKTTTLPRIVTGTVEFYSDTHLLNVTIDSETSISGNSHTVITINGDVIIS